ncbi:hypothetical protein PP175_04695 [Aneurinibacillus sp. Ricciae_BoGa-3]|uniref:hypothetical protein n=1 Tax=Aneurinibacillus sp. Ricciae_BoGa-3 TaxID=3022697 RepID=UPI002341F975|nr:hypothetical protein [Aneurinibacillus sp. Ricciae_BoGa-3]WCK55284.1 hypothetical protein PP175_04695 [Aneurinibacillus sp. Ricciae_BoGa-3]
MNMIRGRVFGFNKHSVVPQKDKHDNRSGEVITYTISENELAKYRQLPPVNYKKPMSLACRKK